MRRQLSQSNPERQQRRHRKAPGAPAELLFEFLEQAARFAAVPAAEVLLGVEYEKFVVFVVAINQPEIQRLVGDAGHQALTGKVHEQPAGHVVGALHARLRRYTRLIRRQEIVETRRLPVISRYRG